MHPSKIKGTVNELLCQSFFIKLGYIVSIPVCEDCKYDFIADVNVKQLTNIYGKNMMNISKKSNA